MSDKDLVKALEVLVLKETIDGQDIAEIAETCVMLEVAFKPVIRDRVTQADDELFHDIPPVINVVKERLDGNYEIHWADAEGSPDFEIISVPQLKVMRARYLMVLNFYRRKWHKITRPLQQQITSQYDIGFIPDPKSELGKMLQE